MTMIENYRRKLAYDRKKELDKIREKSGNVKKIKLSYKKEK